MTHSRRLLPSLLAVLLLQTAGQAQDFTLDVPVELHKIHPAIKTFAVTAAVYDGDPKNLGSRVAIGNSGVIPILNGEYVGTVTLKCIALPAKDPMKALTYDCSLLLQGPPGYQGDPALAMRLDGPYPYDPARPVVSKVQGPIVRPKLSGPSPVPKPVGKSQP
jgi:hypothetical protein